MLEKHCKSKICCFSAPTELIPPLSAEALVKADYAYALRFFGTDRRRQGFGGRSSPARSWTGDLYIISVAL
jgi:hypothetical protein